MGSVAHGRAVVAGHDRRGARAAQLGRPVAGKTGTTSSNKDSYFVGFSSGITTGVWMGRDDSRVVPGLQGGTAPARVRQALTTAKEHLR